jgi:hypothetical protein
MINNDYDSDDWHCYYLPKSLPSSIQHAQTKGSYVHLYQISMIKEIAVRLYSEQNNGFKIESTRTYRDSNSNPLKVFRHVNSNSKYKILLASC